MSALFNKRKLFRARSRRTGSMLVFFGALLIVPGVSPAQSKPSVHSFDSLARQASEARDADRLDEAVTLFKKALAIRPNWPEGWWSLGTLEYDRNNYAAAARAFRRLLPLAPKDGTAHAMLGLCEYELDQDDAALIHLEEAKTLDISTNPQLRLVLLNHDGILLLRAGRFRPAQDIFASLCQESNRSEAIVNDLGLAVLRLSPKAAPPEGTPDAAIVEQVGYAACLSAQKKYDEARKQYEELITQHPEYPNLHCAYGKFLVEVNDVPAAVRQFQQELLRDPADVNSRLEIAAAQYKFDSAAGIPFLQQAIRLNPHIPFAHYLLGLLYLDTDEYKQAIPELEIAQRAFPKDAKVQFALGSAYSHTGRKLDAEKARANFQRLNKAYGGESQPSY